MKLNEKTLELIEEQHFRYMIVVRLMNTANAIGLKPSRYDEKLKPISDLINNFKLARDTVYEDEESMNITMKAFERNILPSINSQLLYLVYDLSDGLCDATRPVKEKKPLESLFL